MSFDEVIYRNQKFPEIEMNILRSKDCSIDNKDEWMSYNFLEKKENRIVSKNVHFPDEDNLVTHYFEVKKYWQNYTVCSNEDLIIAYRNSCQAYNIKPIPVLLDQVKDIKPSVSNERYDILNLSNVKLDLKHVESLEEIFKHRKFKTLNFENSMLDDDSALSLFEIIEHYESCIKLDLSHNGRISYAGFNALSKMIKKTPCLESIELRGIVFTDTMIPSLSRGIRLGSTLKILHLENSNISSKNLLILSSALKLNVHLRELHLSGNKLIPSDGIHLGSLLKVNKRLKTLDVRNNCLGDIGLGHLCAGLFNQYDTSESNDLIDGLASLVLWNNSISHLGMPCLSRGLKITKTLKSLNLGNNPISSEGVLILKEGLMTNNSLFRLSLANCKITCGGSIAIAEYLADTHNLMRLDIRNNDIKTAGLMAISLSMKVNTSVIKLDVDSNPKKDANIKAYFETQSESLRIIQERLLENKKLSVHQQELEFLQSFTSESKSSSETSEAITGVQSDSASPDETTEKTKYLGMECPKNEITDNDDDAMKYTMSLELSPMPNPYGSSGMKTVSPTDRMLEIKERLSYEQTVLPVVRELSEYDNGYYWNSDFKCEADLFCRDIDDDSLRKTVQPAGLTETDS